ncbi:MAG: CotH kinase family protein [Prevotella sp.]|nr:CotH kinase family protein [Prevotella sp.]
MHFFIYLCYIIPESSRAMPWPILLQKLYDSFKFHPSKMPPLRSTIISLLLLLAVNMTAVAQDDFQLRIASVGMEDIKNDWSDSTAILLPIPTCAYANITGISALPKTKTANYHGWLEVYDGNGNYFKKRIIISAQGRSAVSYAKKNFKIDFCEDEWMGEETTDVTFSDWVTQDGFHLKAFSFDWFKGTGIQAYRTYDLMTRDRGEYGRIWERANINKPDVKALCHPDAFPVVIYFNGKFQGLYCWQLKKHRKNMNQKKNNPDQIHLEGYPLNKPNFWNGVINWKQVWVRTPKDLYDMDGKVYDSDNPTELMDETSPYYNLETDDAKTKERKQNSALVKAHLVELSHRFEELNTLVDNGASKAEMRAVLEQIFDVPGIIDYMLHNLLTVNWDGVWMNYQWFTYDGYKWYVAPYDLDNTFGYGSYRILPGGYYNNFKLLSKENFIHSPTYWVYIYFKQDMFNRWAEIRNQGFVTPEVLASLFDTWYHSFGEENYRLEREKWPTSQSLLPDIDNAPWEQQPFNYNTFKDAPTWDANSTYKKGYVVKLVNRIYKTNADTKGVNPYQQIGKLDSLERIYPYLVTHIKALDQLTGYTFSPTFMSHMLYVSAVGWATICLPFQFAVPEGMSVYAVNGKRADGRLNLVKVSSPEANKPYLVEAAPGNYLLSGYSEERDGEENELLAEGSLRGTLAPHYVPEGCYVLQNHNGNVGFYRVAENGKVRMGANKAWLVLDENASNNYVLDDYTTDIANAAGDSPQVTDIYDMRGVKRSNIGKGINIIRYSNGKTVKVIED